MAGITNYQTESHTRHAFTLVELLVVISIIGLLIGIAVPALTNARTSAKVVQTAAQIKSFSEGLDLFKGDNERNFRFSNGYPPSRFAEDQALDGQQGLYGAQWLVRYLAGMDFQGYIARKDIPKSILEDGRATPHFEKGYYVPAGQPDSIADDMGRAPDRSGPYINVDKSNFAFPYEFGEPRNDPPSSTGRVPPMDAGDTTEYTTNGEPGGSEDGSKSEDQPVFVDSFNMPILYYVANPNGNVLAEINYEASTSVVPGDDPGAIADIRGVYVHEDNIVFTGWDLSISTSEEGPGNSITVGLPYELGKPHPLGRFGTVDPLRIDTYTGSFTDVVHDEQVHEATETSETEGGVIRAKNKDRFLLISAGPDQLFGTSDDITNVK